MVPRLAITLASVAVVAQGACGLVLADTYEGPNDAGAPIDGSAGDASSDAPLDGGSHRDAVPSPDAPSTIPDAAVGPAGYALHFDGTSYVDFGTLPIPSDFTVEAWISPDAPGSGEEYVVSQDREGQTDGQFRMGTIAAGNLFFMMSDSSGASHGLKTNGIYTAQSPSPMPPRQWTHVAVTKSGATFQVFVNGALLDTVLTSQSFSFGTSTGNNPFRVAARTASDGTSSDGEFIGIVDEVRLWNIARTPQDIATDRTTTITSGHPQWNSLVGLWHFDEGSGKSTADAKGKFPGTLVSNPTWVPSTAY